MSDERREIFGDSFATPVHVKLTGGRYFFIALSGLMIWLTTSSINMQLRENNEIKKQEIELKKAALELQRRQFVLDSLRFEHEKHIR